MLILKLIVSDAIGYCSGWCGQCSVCGDDPNNTGNDNNEGCRLGTASSLWSLGSLPGEGFHQPQTRRHGAVPHSAVSTPAIHLVYNHFIGLQSPLEQPGTRQLCKLVLITRLDLDSQLASTLKNFLPMSVQGL